MNYISDEEFQHLIDKALSSLPGEHVKNIKNVAILYEDIPSAEQRTKLNLHSGQTLLGLYEGTPLSQRNGLPSVLPDRITLYKIPLMQNSTDENSLYENIKHTLWHEIAHYYGLNHDQIRGLE
jgi:predicted Zn-dependent protease with MMP-like domain